VLDSTIQSSDDQQPSLREQPSLGQLSYREREVLDLVATGLTNEQVARRLSLSVHAIKFHLARIYRKLAVANRTEAVFVLMTNRRLDD
jgi:two-component system, NarL family, nitrate/nitrite response regulator NarL